MGLINESKEALKNLWDNYKKNRNFWQGRENILQKAYDEITEIKALHDAADKRLASMLRHKRWKGKTRNSFIDLLDALEICVDRHYSKINHIHDEINIEKNTANDNYSLFNGLASDVKTKWENLTN